MSTFSVLLKDLRQQPPSSVDPENLERSEERALAALSTIADTLSVSTHGLSTNRFTRENWFKIWPWLFSLCRGVLDKPPPKTIEGMAVVYQVIAVAPAFLNYPVYQRAGHETPHSLLKPLLKSTPRALALTLEMWLTASATNHPSRERLATALGLLLETLVEPKPESISRLVPAGEALQEYCKIVDGPPIQRWDEIASCCIREIIHDLRQPHINTFSLYRHLFILSTLAYGGDAEVPLKQLSQQDAVRWAACAVAKLTQFRNLKNIYTGPGYRFEDLTACFIESLRFLFFALHRDILLTLKALDEGILVSIFKAREMIMEDARWRGWTSNSALVRNVDAILEWITVGLVYRPILVRVTRSLKRIEKLESEMGLSEAFPPDECGPLTECWNKLKSVVSRRNMVRSYSGHYFGKDFHQVCAYDECSFSWDDHDTRRPYLRCSGCDSTVYCSRECQKSAWNKHSKVCKDRRRELQGGDTRHAGGLEYAALHKQVAFDVLENAETMKQLKDQYHIDHPSTVTSSDSARVLVWMDYSKNPIAMEVISHVEGEKRFHHFCGNPGKPFDKFIDAIAKIPWRSNDNPILIVHRDRIKDVKGTGESQKRRLAVEF
ncbi:hypothetical protein AAF712_010561 [Marasmius tenuissimus]|uniref:MYND-type domain-containing protein n=1 Tax=Marasmius tenuissimus TaxID=585030 RepID=A0ABR2ZLH9_9AGAR|nr:hypothetical protein PM082_021107 [Marasmius tenuissimus]